MNWLNTLASTLNIFKKTPPIEEPISTEPIAPHERVQVQVAPVEPEDDSVAPAISEPTLSDVDVSHRRLLRHWKSIKERWPNSEVTKADKWGMLTSVQKGMGSCKCLACGRKFGRWEEGRTHECEHEKEFRRVTKRFKPRRNNAKKDRPNNTQARSPGSGSRVSTHGVGVVEDSRGDNTNPGGSPPGGKG